MLLEGYSTNMMLLCNPNIKKAQSQYPSVFGISLIHNKSFWHTYKWND